MEQHFEVRGLEGVRGGGEGRRGGEDSQGGERREERRGAEGRLADTSNGGRLWSTRPLVSPSAAV
jgi:hypothetical protein